MYIMFTKFVYIQKTYFGFVSTKLVFSLVQTESKVPFCELQRVSERPVVFVDAKKETRRGKTMNKNLQNKPVAHITGADPCFRSTKRFTFAIL